VLSRLGDVFPGTAEELCALHHVNPFELLAATILSAQCTDERVNAVTPALFARYPTPGDLAGADPEELEAIIRSTGFFHAKAQSLMGMARGVEERFGGAVPSRMEDLVSLPGVGRKTANVVLSVAFSLPGLPVDTHVGRLSKRLGLTIEDDPVKVERDLCSYLVASDWGAMSLRLILHGRATCKARKPDCATCVLADICPSVAVASAVTSSKGARGAKSKVAAASARSGSTTAKKTH
jgi:endonuclease-3